MRARSIVVGTIVVVLASASAALAQGAPPADLQKARGERAEALAKGDKAVFDKLTTESFIVIDPTGRVETKTERGARVVPPANPPQGPPAARENERVAMYNNNTAVATWDQAQQGTPTHFMEIWVMDKGQWKCAAANVNRPNAPAGGGEGRRGRRE